MSASPAAGRPMRVLHAVPEFWLERTQAWLYLQITSLPATVENHVVCNKTMLLDEFPFPRVHCLADAGVRLRLWQRLVDAMGGRRRFGWQSRVARQVQPDLIHSHFGPTGWLAMAAARVSGARQVVTFYGLDVNCLPKVGWATRYTELFAAIDLVLCEGPFMRQSLIALGCPTEKARMQRLGVDLERLPFRPRAWRPGEPLRVLLAASFREKKGLPYAIEALGRLQQSVPLQVTLVGGRGGSADSLAETARIEMAITSSGLGERLQRRGFLAYDDLLREAYANHVFLSPSVIASNGDTEGGAPFTLIEMAASGMPIVSTRHCDIPDIVEDGVTGLLANERDVDGLVDCLQRLVAEHERWPAMLAAGRQRIAERHDCHTQAAALAGHYRELLAR